MRLLADQLDHLLLSWFVDVEMAEAVWNYAVSSRHRRRLLNEEIACRSYRRALEQTKPYLSDEHIPVDANED